MDEGIRELNELILEMAAWKVRHKDARLDEESVVRIQALTRLLLENPRELKEKKVAQVGPGPLKGKCGGLELGALGASPLAMGFRPFRALVG